MVNWHRRRYCPKGFRPPYVVRRAYKWTYLYAALDPTSGESFCLYLPGMDGLCLEAFLEHLGTAYADHHLLLVVLDGAPSHTSSQITLPKNVSLLRLPAYSPELNPVERWFQEFRRALSNRIFESVELLQKALTKALEPYWQDPSRLRSLAPVTPGLPPDMRQTAIPGKDTSFPVGGTPMNPLGGCRATCSE